MDRFARIHAAYLAAPEYPRCPVEGCRDELHGDEPAGVCRDCQAEADAAAAHEERYFRSRDALDRTLLEVTARCAAASRASAAHVEAALVHDVQQELADRVALDDETVEALAAITHVDPSHEQLAAVGA